MSARWWYSALGKALTPALPLWLKHRANRGKEDPARLEERFGFAGTIVPAAPIVWLHAASVGEAQSILPLTAALHAALPTHHFLITTGTRTSAALIAANPKPYLTHQVAPLDVSSAVARFLETWRPHLAIWVESELWPQLVWHTAARHIPMMLVNGRISPRSFARWRRFPKLSASLLGAFDVVYAGSSDDAARLRMLGAPEVMDAGNLKFDSAILPVAHEAASLLQQQIGSRPCWLAASTHAGEEAQLVEVHKILKALHPDLLSIVVPRHANRGHEIAAIFAAANLTVAQRSAHAPITAATEIYVADTMGELGLFYQQCEVAFIGGSLVPHGGHNPLEPARQHCSILCGPHTLNFAPIIEEMLEHHAITVVGNTTELAKEVQHQLSDAAHRHAMAQRAHHYVTTRQGATGAIVDMACTLLKEGSHAAA